MGRLIFGLTPLRYPDGGSAWHSWGSRCLGLFPSRPLDHFGLLWGLGLGPRHPQNVLNYFWKENSILKLKHVKQFSQRIVSKYYTYCFTEIRLYNTQGHPHQRPTLFYTYVFLSSLSYTLSRLASYTLPRIISYTLSMFRLFQKRLNLSSDTTQLVTPPFPIGPEWRIQTESRRETIYWDSLTCSFS